MELRFKSRPIWAECTPLTTTLEQQVLDMATMSINQLETRGWVVLEGLKIPENRCWLHSDETLAIPSMRHHFQIRYTMTLLVSVYSLWPDSLVYNPCLANKNTIEHGRLSWGPWCPICQAEYQSLISPPSGGLWGDSRSLGYKARGHEEAPLTSFLLRNFLYLPIFCPPQITHHNETKDLRSQSRDRIRAGVRFSLSVDCFLMTLGLV